ncbi:hypothetical protein LJB83_00830 [Clostridia bacterium OttesenSCG-928-F22]|nr:hypothetical protein [Clostridia bacterium OttesenSCG-928-F22]
MNAQKIAELLQAKPLTELHAEVEVSAGYAGDLLSWVMAKCPPGAAWITVQTHLNVIAVAVMLDLALLIIPDSIEMEQASIDKANEEGITVLSTPMSVFECCGVLYKNGLPHMEK